MEGKTYPVHDALSTSPGKTSLGLGESITSANVPGLDIQKIRNESPGPGSAAGEFLWRIGTFRQYFYDSFFEAENYPQKDGYYCFPPMTSNLISYCKKGITLVKNSSLYYSVGALLYCPANNDSIADSIINNKFGRRFSLALCLEDTINDSFVPQAEQILSASLTKICHALSENEFYLPKIFIRVRSSRQISRIYHMLGESASLVTGFIVPKFSLTNADDYIQTICKLNETARQPVYMMPIYESPSIIDLRKRYDILYTLKDKIDIIKELILNIRVGGNDLCHVFGYRRHVNESIHRIRPIAQIFSDINTVYGMDYVISGPVWEYFNGSNWEQGLQNEISDDKLCGFTGKTVIHPNQIPIVNDAYAVSAADYESANAILHWNKEIPSFVSSDPGKERMNEYKTHTNWAQKIIFLADCYGIRN